MFVMFILPFVMLLGVSCTSNDSNYKKKDFAPKSTANTVDSRSFKLSLINRKIAIKKDSLCKAGSFQLFHSKHRIKDIKAMRDPCPPGMSLASISSNDMSLMCNLVNTCGIDGKCTYIKEFGNDSCNGKKEFTICADFGNSGCRVSFQDRGGQKLKTFICQIN